MNDDQLLEAVRIAASVPADGWGVTWNPLYHPAHCAELIASKQVNVSWESTAVGAICMNQNSTKWESTDPLTPASNAASMRRAVVRAVIGGAA